jgi:hypothetical protein
LVGFAEEGQSGLDERAVRELLDEFNSEVVPHFRVVGFDFAEELAVDPLHSQLIHRHAVDCEQDGDFDCFLHVLVPEGQVECGQTAVEQQEGGDIEGVADIQPMLGLDLGVQLQLPGRGEHPAQSEFLRDATE